MFCVALCFPLLAADLPKRPFDLQAGDAAVSLKAFADQSGQEIVYRVDTVRGTRTNAVKGDFTPKEAIDLMLAGTPVAAMQTRSGLLSVTRSRSGPDATSSPSAVVMSAFEVASDKDIGYQGGNTTSGSRLNSSLQDTAAAITVVTPEFISDFGVSTLTELAAYAPNFAVDFQEDRAAPGMAFLGGSNLHDTRIRVRGLSASTALDFFETSVAIDTYISERAEISGGPNSILFGFGSPGGVVNISTKKANTARRRTAIRAQFGEWDFSRYELDHNQLIVPGRLALRLNGVQQNSGGWRNYDFSDIRRGAGSLSFTPWEKTRITANYERGRMDSHASRPINAVDALALWQQRGSTTLSDAAWTAASRAAGVNRNTTVRNLYITHADGTGPFVVTTSNTANNRLLESTYEDLNIPVAQRAGQTLVTASQLPFTYDAHGPGSVRNSDFNRLFMNLEQRLTKDVMLDFAYLKEKSNQWVAIANQPVFGGDPNTVIPNPSGTGTTVANPNVGRLYIDTTWNGDRGWASNEVFRAAVSWKLDLGKFGTHQLAALGEHGNRRNGRTPMQEILVDAAGMAINNATVPENSTNFVSRRHYVIPGDYNTYFGGDSRQPITVTRGARTFHNAWIVGGLQGRDLERPTNTLLAVTQSNFFDSRVVVTAGIRSDRFRYEQHAGERLSPTDPRVVSGRQVANSLAFTSQIDRSFIYQPVTATVGGVYHAARWLSFFYNRANNNDQPNQAITILPDKALPPQSEGQTQDFGVMLRFLDGRIFLRTTAFKTSQKKATGAVGLGGEVVVAPTGRIMNTLLENNRITAAEREEHGLDNAANLGATSDIVTQGLELSTSFNVTKSLTALLNFSYTDKDQSRIGSEFEGWFEREKAFWLKTPGAGSLVDVTAGSSINEEIASIQRNVAERRDLNGFNYGERPYKVNGSGRYAFTEGRLKGAFVGGGVRWQSTSKLGRRIAGTSAMAVRCMATR